jgi:hypothetical protein
MRAAALVLAALAAVAHGAASGREPRAASTMRATLLCVLGAGLVRGAPRPLRRGLDAQLALIERDVADLEIRTEGDAQEAKILKLIEVMKGPNGWTKDKLEGADFTADEIAAGLNALQKAGMYTAAKAKKAGFTAAELKAAQYTAAELKQAGYTATELKAAQYTAAELKQAGYTATELKAAQYTAVKAIDAGFTVQEVNDAGYEISNDQLVDLYIIRGYTDSQAEAARAAGFTADVIEQASAKIKTTQAAAAGFTPEAIKAEFSLRKSLSSEEIMAASMEFFRENRGGFYEDNQLENLADETTTADEEPPQRITIESFKIEELIPLKTMQKDLIEELLPTSRELQETVAIPIAASVLRKVAIAGEAKAFPILTKILESVEDKAEITGTHMRIKSLCDASTGQCKNACKGEDDPDSKGNVLEEDHLMPKTSVTTFVPCCCKDADDGKHLTESLEGFVEGTRHITDSLDGKRHITDSLEGKLDRIAQSANMSSPSSSRIRMWCSHRFRSASQSTSPPKTYSRRSSRSGEKVSCLTRRETVSPGIVKAVSRPTSGFPATCHVMATA